MKAVILLFCVIGLSVFADAGQEALELEILHHHRHLQHHQHSSSELVADTAAAPSLFEPPTTAPTIAGIPVAPPVEPPAAAPGPMDSNELTRDDSALDDKFLRDAYYWFN